MAELSKTARTLLETIVSAGSTGTHGDPKKLSSLVKAGMVEVNEKKTNDKGHIAVRATDAGIVEAEGVHPIHRTQRSAPAPEPVAKTTGVSGIVSGVPMPASNRRASKYRTDDLEVGDSFFVAAGADISATSKTINGVVHNANRKWSEPTGEMTTTKNGKSVPMRRVLRKFASARVADGKDWGFPGVPGVAVFRTG